MKLLELRLKNNYTQTEIAKIINTTQGNYGKYERGFSKPDIETLCKLADFYGVSLDYLCEHKTKHLLDISSWSDEKMQIIKILEKLDDKNDYALLSYITHIFEQQK